LQADALQAVGVMERDEHVPVSLPFASQPYLFWPGTHNTSPFRVVIDDAAGDEQQIGDAVDVADAVGVDVLALDLRQRHHGALGSAADGAGQMQRGRRWRAAGQDEGFQRLQIGVQRVDIGLQRTVCAATMRSGS
jgi:hypothetical protein